MEQKLSLCPDCCACPEVQLKEDRAVLCDEGRCFELSKQAWNQLVEYIETGKLKKL